LLDFSGYLAIDEVYDGPFCILSAVDNRQYNRLTFRVLEHDPAHQDIRSFLAELKAGLEQRGLAVKGVTTDGSTLYPKPLAELWPGVPHQVCRFHVLKDITKCVLHAVAKVRKDLTAKIPKGKRGRPAKQDQAKTRRIARQKKRVAELFEHRHLFVRRRLSPTRQKLLQRLTRGLPQLRTLRRIMDEVYRLFDRRCQTATALRRLAQLRGRVKRFKRLGKTLEQLQSPNLEKALVYLDDRLLGSTSNAVERSNRRFRKAQKSIYSVRTKRHLEQRLALDLFREQGASRRVNVLKTLHLARADSG
jgi:Transposase